MECLLDCQLPLSQLQEQLAAELNFPQWYGHNLDALHDCLTGLTAPVTIQVLHGNANPVLVQVLQDSAAENPTLTLVFP